jgi:hypothetical protein
LYQSEREGPYACSARLRSRGAQRLCNAIQLAFLNDSLVRFIGIFNPVLIVIAFGWQELRNLIKTVAPRDRRILQKAHRLTDFEFMPVHEALHQSNGLAYDLVGGTKQLQLLAL